ncbi:DUF6461 domain-containing protein [Micromonospora sp. NPDC000018]|uniref:DUF6461 domain-containing protein n=1 Tax=Micromonospora sp. NPDC000018 TaxID=3154239 RepID=UPI00332627EA
MPEALPQFHTLDEPVMSQSGRWELRYDADGRAVIADQDSTVTWSAGAAGVLRLEPSGVFAVYSRDEVVWRGDVQVVKYTALRVSDDGDAMLYDDGFPVHSVLHGPIEPVSLGDRAPLADIRHNRFIRSANGKRTVHRTADGTGLVYRTRLGPGLSSIVVVQPAEVRRAEQPDTWLTWRFLDDGVHGAWRLVLIGPDDAVHWVFGRERGVARGAGSDDDGDAPEWLATGLKAHSAYCITVIHDVDPDEALRRFGALDTEISTATWTQLRRRADFEDLDSEGLIVAAFALGPHTLLVEDGGHEAVDRPDLSRGTFAVSSFSSADDDHRFLVSEDGEVLASFTYGLASLAEGADPTVLTEPLAEMGIDDIDEFDDDDDSFLDDVELLCRVAGVSPEIGDVTAPARGAILRRPDVRRRRFAYSA